MDRSSPQRGGRVLALCLSVAAAALLVLCSTPAVAAGATQAAGATPTPSPTPVWVATASGPGGGAAAGRVVVRDPQSGALYVAGDARVSATVSEVMIVKYDAAGAQQWTATYRHAGSGPQTAVDGALTKAGDFVVLCEVRGPKSGADWAVLEYTSSGTRKWARTIAGAGAGNDVPGRLALSPSGAIYAAGALFAAHHGLDAALVKLTAAGKVVWKCTIAGPGRGADRFSALGIDRTGRVFCAGTVASAGNRGADCLLSAYSPAGRRLWLVTWGGPAHRSDGVNDLVVTPGGRAFAVGFFGTNSGTCAMIRRYDAGGRFVWQGRYSTEGGGRDQFVAAALLPHGGVVATGSFVSATTGNSNIVTVGFAAHGPSVWQQIWDTPHPPSGYSDDQAEDVAVDATGRVFVCGYVSPGSATGTDFAVLGYTSAGDPIWNAPRTWDGGVGDDDAWALTPAPGGVVVTGQSWVLPGHFQMATVELPY